MGARSLQPVFSAGLRQRRLLPALGALFLGVFVVLILCDHLGCFGYRGDDWAIYDGKPAVVSNVSSSGTLLVKRDRHETELRLLGLKLDGSTTVCDALRRNVMGKTVLIKLDSPQTRDSAGHLLGYVYLSEGECLNVDLAHDGLARADRDWHGSMHAVIAGAESDARRHGRGIWGGWRPGG